MRSEQRVPWGALRRARRLVAEEEEEGEGE
jgi:hypothetical protein